MEHPNHFVVLASGQDKPGLVELVTGALADRGCNIIDIEQSVVRGLFIITLLVDPPPAFQEDPVPVFQATYDALAGDVGLVVHVSPYHAGRRQLEANTAVLTILGKDRPGIVYGLAKFLAHHDVNIQRTKMISRGELIAMEMELDVAPLLGERGLTGAPALPVFRKALQDHCEGEEIGHIFQLRDVYDKEKKVIVFDMDATLVNGETINHIARCTPHHAEVARITEQAMRGELDFRAALKARVRLLEGVPYAELERIAQQIELNPGAIELVDALKKMGYKIALISGGFTVFTEQIKTRLGLDYAFGNKLVVGEDGVLTGEVNENLIVDGEKKGEILQWLARVEQISPEQIVAVGDGNNDRFMLQNAGLGIGFEPKEILKQSTDGVLSRNLFGILFCLGIPDKKLREFVERPP